MNRRRVEFGVDADCATCCRTVFHAAISFFRSLLHLFLAYEADVFTQPTVHTLTRTLSRATMLLSAVARYIFYVLARVACPGAQVALPTYLNWFFESSAVCRQTSKELAQPPLAISSSSSSSLCSFQLPKALEPSCRMAGSQQ